MLEVIFSEMAKGNFSFLILIAAVAQIIIYLKIPRVEKIEKCFEVGENVNCEVCGEKLEWGNFAYDQVMCFDCFKAKILKLVAGLPEEEQKMILYMLDVLKAKYCIGKRPNVFRT